MDTNDVKLVGREPEIKKTPAHEQVPNMPSSKATEATTKPPMSPAAQRSAFLNLFDMRLHEASKRAGEIVELADQPDAIDAHVFQPWFIASLVWLPRNTLARVVCCRHSSEVLSR